ncbi:MAG: hypothetical protein A3F67_02980 [Verrucomicrobia bacterium RIFCSPHIGHO2_12_FULL_41_10]|nr:MAG: hypothetical protein A3F67_02980 [Verrucomicrobia bacterium RIFCSPHIGHO2_12_FULL_41_10]
MNRLNVTIIQNNWQQVLPQLGVFDAIFFNEIDLEVLVDTHRPKKFGNLLVQSGKDLNAKVTALFPQITTLRYTEADIDGLFQIVGRSSSKAFTTFLTELKENGQISHEQYTSTLLKYGLQPSFPRMKDPMLEFLEAVLPHMQKGSRFSCFASFAVSLFENPDFFASIITHPDLLYTETWMSIDVPENCSYYKGTKALLMRVEKVNN